MDFDERFGWVERGTKGHRASAQVMDLEREIATLDRIFARYDDMSLDTNPSRVIYQPSLAQQEAWHTGQRSMYEGYRASRIASGEIDKARRCAFLALAHKLATMTPFFDAVRRSDYLRNARYAADVSHYYEEGVL